MSYFADQDIDTRTCGQADEDAYLDRRDGITSYTHPAVIAAIVAPHRRKPKPMSAKPMPATKQVCFNTETRRYEEVFPESETGGDAVITMYWCQSAGRYVTIPTDGE